jgi:sulfhydrogenase subunit beta (sulfur reductase)
MEKSFVLAKSDFQKFLQRLSTFGAVHAPVRVSDQSFAYKPVDLEKEIAFEALRTILPPKKFLYPQREALFSYDESGIVSEPQINEPLVIFGSHPCDLAGMKVLDYIFTAPPGDSLYIERRKHILIVGLSCLPDKYCFCESMGTDSVDDGYDVFLTDIDDHFFVEVATPKAAELLSDNDFLIPASEPYKQAFKDFWHDRKALFTNRFETSNLPALLDLEADNPVWEELGNRCLSCGNCTFVCPTCYCFDIVDIAQLNGKGQREREWDSCQFTDFAKVAGNNNFRPGPIDRLKFWYRHKLHGFQDAYQLPTCVGCGRCTVSCPAEIDDIVGVVVRLEGSRQRDSIYAKEEKN